MNARAREVELLLLTIFAALPLYATQAISAGPLIVFDAAMAAVAIRVALGKSPELIPLPLMRALAVGFLLFYPFDAAVISRSAIAASAHLVLFTAVYQPMEPSSRDNEGQRLLIASLLFVASVATSTHIAIVPFIIAFAFLMIRRFMLLSHDRSAQAVGAAAIAPPVNRAAAFYVCGTTLVGIALFPVLPRVRNPLVPGMIGSLSSAATGLSDSINFNEPRTIIPDPAIVSRVWMGPEAIPFFTPLRLRGVIYERFSNNEWLQAKRRDFVPLATSDGRAQIARPAGFTRPATVQQRFVVGSRLFLPVGTYEIVGVPQVVEGPTRDIYTAWQSRRDMIDYDVWMARSTAPLRPRPVAVSDYPVTPAVAAMARQIVGNESDPMRQAARVESYLSSNFHYVPDPSQLGGRVTVDDFLLRVRRGHCEYFAAGMVALMTALDVPARIVGGFYGGTLNPLTGYFAVRREDAHAWVEVYDGTAWRTFDPTPPAMRPGNTQSGLLGVYASALSDSVNYFWDRYILTYGLADQLALAADLIVQTRRAIAAMALAARGAGEHAFSARYAAVAAVAIAFAFLLFWLGSRRISAFELLRRHLRDLGIEVGLSMTMEEALAEVRRSRPESAVLLEPLIALYEEERFSPRTVRARRIIRRRLAQLA